MSLLNPKTDYKNNKTTLIPDEKSHIAWVHKENHPAKQKWPISDDLGLRSPVIQKTFQEKVLPRS